MPFERLFPGGVTHAPLFAGILFLLLTILGLNVSLYRISAKVPLGSADPGLLRKNRAHGNAVEHSIPLVILLLLLELQGVSKPIIVALGCAMVLSRALHAFGFLNKIRAGSLSGIVITYTLELVMSLWVIVNSWLGLS